MRWPSGWSQSCPPQAAWVACWCGKKPFLGVTRDTPGFGQGGSLVIQPLQGAFQVLTSILCKATGTGLMEGQQAAQAPGHCGSKAGWEVWPCLVEEAERGWLCWLIG